MLAPTVAHCVSLPAPRGGRYACGLAKPVPRPLLENMTPTLPEGAAAPAVWQSQSRGPDWLEKTPHFFATCSVRGDAFRDFLLLPLGEAWPVLSLSKEGEGSPFLADRPLPSLPPAGEGACKNRRSAPDA